VVRIVKDLDLDLTGRHVLVVEDIVDSGLTLSYLRRNLMARGPASLEVCALLVKEGLQKSDPDLRYVGFTIPPDFVVGYGLDAGEVRTAEIADGQDEVRGELKAGGEKYVSKFPADYTEALTTRLLSHGVQVENKVHHDNVWLSLAGTFLPIILLFAGFLFIVN